MLGPWWGQGEDADAVSVFQGLKTANPNTTYTPGCTLTTTTCTTRPTSARATSGFAAGVAASKAADQIVLAVGETREMSGEAEARSMIDLPGKQEDLIHAIRQANPGKPMAVVLFNGRPLRLTEVYPDTPAMLEAWFPGIEGGNAVADVLYGKVDPGGKLPGLLPAQRGPDADLLQPRADGPSVRRRAEVRLAPPRHPVVRPAVRVRLRDELHDVQDLERHGEPQDDERQERQRRGQRRR